LRIGRPSNVLLDGLKNVLDGSPVGAKSYLETEYGVPFTANGFGGWFRDRWDEADLHVCTAHGLRRAGATFAAENGATVSQLMAIFGWATAKQAVHYVEEANQPKIASSAMHLIVANDGWTELSHCCRPKCPTIKKVNGKKLDWWAGQDSNLQPDRYERPALTIELPARPECAPRG
jgi:hypothetical protein